MTPCPSRIRTWSIRRFREDRGVALVLALLVMSALTISTGTVLYITSSSARDSSRQSADGDAYALAEAGINTAIAKIYGAADPRLTATLPAGTAGDPATVVPRCSTGTNPEETPSCYSTGSVTYSGTLDTTQGNTWFWTIVSIGSVPNPAAPGRFLTRRLTRSVGITGSNGTDGNAWTRFYQDSAASCLTLDNVTVPTNFAARGNVCLVNGATVTGEHTNINAGGSIYIDPPDPPTGRPGSGTGWTSSSRAETSNNSYATYSIARSADSASLDMTDFGFAIPSSATITGITVDVERKASSNTASNYITDTDVYLLRSGATAGTDHALTTTKWPSSDGSQDYGSTADLWGTTWTAAQLNSSSFGVRLRAHATCSSSCTLTASVDAISVTVTYTTDAAIGAAGSPIEEVHVGVGCQLRSQGSHAPCDSSDRVWAGTSDVTPVADNPAIGMPQIDWNYWWANAKPGPKHFCTNPNPGISTSFFDNDSATTSAPNRSITINGEMAAAGHPYDCEVWENGVLKGMLKWDGAHRLDVFGTIFVDGNFRFDEDGEIIHYFGRATIMSSRDDEIDAVVCSGGTGNTYDTSCLANPGNWDPTQNMLVLMSNMNNEYDQGSTTCSGSPPSCYQGHKPAGFQGILYSTADCLIHQDFQDSGPVICNTISLPYEPAGNPAYYAFPSIGKLTDGMSVSSTANATDLTISVSAQSDG
jgi:hypothetical protein